MRQRLPILLAVAAFLVTLWTVPVWWCKRGAAEWFAGGRETQDRLARTVAAQIEAGLSAADYHTKSELFDGEWLFGTYLMAGIGFCQIVQQHPEDLEKWRPSIETCIRQLLSPAVRAFDHKSWQADALETLAANQGHAAYLGYLNFLLSLYRQITPANEFAALNDAITEALVRRADASPNGLIATYPGEWYPVDNSPGLASIALHGRATGRDYSAFLARREAVFRQRFLDPSTGLLIQAMNSDGTARDVPRGSGTTLAVFFLSRGFPALSADLFASVRGNLVSGLFNFGAIREFPRRVEGRGDIDSGPVVFGFGFSASGFGLAGARAYQDERLFSSLYASAILAGAPTRTGGNIDFLTAGPLGNAILLAVLTTPVATP